MGKTKQAGAPVESMEQRAKRLVRLAPKARKVVGDDWIFDNRVECGYLGKTLVGLTNSFEDQDHILDFIEATTPEAIKVLALKALAYDALMQDPKVSTINMSDETATAMTKAEAAMKGWS